MNRKPKNTKYKKQYKGGSGRRIGSGVSAQGRGGNKRSRGEYGLMSREKGRRTGRQREAGRRVRRSSIRRRGKVWMSVYPEVPVTKKPQEVRIGKGKGGVEYWATHVNEGKRRYEVSGVGEARAMKALGKAGKKIPVRTKRRKRER